ncbi:MAG TPA: DPP IV N-terminal domain-containing protein [Gemmatimonadaceae bacterium]|nr:DPP IV N-terminal domain-containing protein [Gemmatimonadaceae bacterium]
MSRLRLITSVSLIMAVTLVTLSAPSAVAQLAPRGARGVVARVMNIHPRFPDGFGSPSRGVHPALVRPGLFAYSPPIRELVSPTADRLAGTNAAGDLYVRAAGSEEKRIIARAEPPWRWDVEGAAWSPDGRRIAVKRIDDSEVPRIPIVDWVGTHETTKLVPYSRVGEPLPKEQVMFVDVASGHTTPVQHGFDDPYVRVVGWSADSHSLRLLRADRLLKHVDLLSADPVTGAVTSMLHESSSTFIVGLKFLDGYESELDSLHLAWFLDTRGEFLWTSERSGFRHLYLYRADGKLIRPLTTMLPGLVHRIVGVDEQRGRVYFTASTDTMHPYRQQLYRVSLAGGRPRKLAEAQTIPRVEFSRSMDSIAVLRTRIPDVLGVDVLDANGASAHTFWKADLGFLKKSSVAPEIAWSLAADGKTHLRSMLFKPARFDAGARYPVIEFIYAGAQQRFIPDALQDPWFWLMHRVADEGFVVVVTDGRGTPGRGKTFQDFAYGRIGQVEIADHAAVLRELAHDRPYMDLSRVGVLGHSEGGYFALRALLLEPTLYKVAHISAGALDLPRFRAWVEPYMGCLIADCPDAYAKGRNTTLIPMLHGHLSINQGTADRDVPFADAMKLVQALEASGKDFELTVYPGANHTIMTAPQWAPRMVEFFRRYLLEGDATAAAPN